MIEKIPGKEYILETANGFPAVNITFCCKTNGVFQDGITNEELIDLLEARFKNLVQSYPSDENLNALTHVRQVKMWVHTRNHKKLQKQKSKHDNSRDGLQLQVEGRQVRQQSQT